MASIWLISFFICSHPSKHEARWTSRPWIGARKHMTWRGRYMIWKKLSGRKQPDRPKTWRSLEDMIIGAIVWGQRSPTGCPFVPGQFSREYWAGLTAFAWVPGENRWSRGWHTGFYRFYHRLPVVFCFPSDFSLQPISRWPFGFGVQHVGPLFFQDIAPLLVNLPLTWFRLKLGDISTWYLFENANTPLDGKNGRIVVYKHVSYVSSATYYPFSWENNEETTGFLRGPSLGDRTSAAPVFRRPRRTSRSGSSPSRSGRNRSGRRVNRTSPAVD